MTDQTRVRSLGVGCETPEEHAESATVHGLVNCYHREADTGCIVPPSEAPAAVTDNRDVLRLELSEQEVTLFAPLRYVSATDRHTFSLPVYVRRGSEPEPIDAATLAALVRRELVLSTDATATAATDLLRRVLLSRREIKRFFSDRNGGIPSFHEGLSFVDAEQSLLYGHLLHPTPKSREGIAAYDTADYAPELRGSMRLRYFAVDPKLVSEWSAKETSATDWVAAGLREADTELPARCKAAIDDGRRLIPVHPWQADSLRSQEYVREAISDGHLADLGTFGPSFYPTSSVRTLWSPETPYMVKSSLGVEITNAKRTTPRSKLRLAVAVAELLDTGYGDRLAAAYPRFSLLADPAAVTVDVGPGVESGFETVLRENPFAGSRAENVAAVVALCQDRPNGPPLLSEIVRQIAEREGRSTATVAREWFRKYLAVTVRPAVWSYFELGVGFEAHQQNTVVKLDTDGWPKAGFYRDNGGYCFPESRYDRVDTWVPGLDERVETVCADAVTDRCLRYYLFINNAFGVVNALGVGGVVEESTLLADLRSEVSSLAEDEPPASNLVSALLEDRQIPCKGNLRTRFAGCDELASSLDAESVYIDIENPLVTKVSPRCK
ncbi:IucA/IucC family protein [Halosimplex sp. J119]